MITRPAHAKCLSILQNYLRNWAREGIQAKHRKATRRIAKSNLCLFPGVSNRGVHPKENRIFRNLEAPMQHLLCIRTPFGLPRALVCRHLPQIILCIFTPHAKWFSPRIIKHHLNHGFSLTNSRPTTTKHKLNHVFSCAKSSSKAARHKPNQIFHTQKAT